MITLLLLCFLLVSCTSNTDTSPNIILIMMDDLGYSDINFNGGIFPTPNLNSLCMNGIKLNYHYANTICSASRSSLLTGRYSWRTGAVNIIYQQTIQHTKKDLAFISNILKNSNKEYNTAMFGKYHLGYSSQSFLPFNRGFDKTLFFEGGATKYSQHLNCPSWGLIFNAMNIGSNIDEELQNDIERKFKDGFCSYDLWDEHYNPYQVNNNIYNERLFTNGIKEYIEQYKDDNNNNNPFFIYYAMPTPHWPLQDPPKLYDECNNMNDRKTFCNVLMYGDELIGEIVDSLKKTDLWSNTVMIFLSDNGPNPNWKGDIKLPKGFGQTLPLRGAKGSTFEGGIRTPSFIYGGYVENHCKNVGNEYNDMVHIADWFAIIQNIAAINNIENDIDGLNLWPHICYNDDNIKRETIIHFEMIDVNDKNEGFKASYIRTNEWKLLINSSLSFVEIPSNKYWVNYDDQYTMKPPRDIYENMMNNDGLSDLFQSQCYDDYINGINDDDSMFEYDDIMLFKISDDNVEACNLAKQRPKIVKRLMNKLINDDNINEYIKYNSDPIKMSKQGTLAQIESYDCDTKQSYHLSWQEIDKYSNEEQVSLSWNEIFQSYIDIVDDCNTSKLSMNTFYHLNNHGIIKGVIVCVAAVSLLSYLWVISAIFKNTWKQKKYDKNQKTIKTELPNERTTLLPQHV